MKHLVSLRMRCPSIETHCGYSYQYFEKPPLHLYFWRRKNFTLISQFLITGNISTSNIRDAADFIELDLRPRFPLFGGWRTQYILGYNVPSYEYLFHSGKHFVLRMRFLDHIFDNMVIDEAEVGIREFQQIPDTHNEPCCVSQNGQRMRTDTSWFIMMIIIIKKFQRHTIIMRL